ncbi:MAG: FecR domain-containing protein [Candidatus Omnitrophica bacterium]|nr:FecR domain-containing protein [Candidatus Omnitrophota bacterium]
MRTLLIYVFIVALASAAMAAEVGKITYTEGRVDIFTSGSDKGTPAVDGALINVGDSIRTKSNSKAEVIFADRTVMRIAQNSKVDILDYTLDQHNNRKSAELRLERGKFRTIIAKMKDSSEFRISTPNSTGVVKGSDIFAYYQAGNSGMLVEEGILSVSNNLKPQEVVSVPAGSAVVIPLEDAPKGPRRYMDMELKFHEQDTNIPETIAARKGASSIKGTITKLTGDVKVTSRGVAEPHQARQGEVLGEGDKVTTGSNGIVEIAFDNGNALYLKPDTHITILKLVVDSKTGEFENLFEAERGGVKARIEGLKGKSKFEVKTPTAICGARGTIMLVHIAANGATSSFFEGGNGYATSLVTGETMEVGAGGGTTVDSTGSITQTEAPSEEDRAAMDEGFDPSGGTSDADGGTDGSALADAGLAGGVASEIASLTDTVDTSESDTVDTDVVNVPITEADSSILDQVTDEVQHIDKVGDFFYASLDAQGDPYLVNDGGGMYDFSAEGPDINDPNDYTLLWTATSEYYPVEVMLSGNYDAADSSGQYHIWTTDDLFSYDSNTAAYTTSDGGAYYCVMGGTIDGGVGGLIKMLAIGLYVDSAGNAGTLFGKAEGDNTTAFTLDQGSSFWVHQVYSTASHSGDPFGILPEELYTSIKDNGSLSGKGYADLGDGSEVTARLVDGFAASFDLSPEPGWGIWASRFAGSYRDVLGGWVMQLAGTSEDDEFKDGVWMQYLSIANWGANGLSGESEGFSLSLSEDGCIKVFALREGRVLGNYVDVDPGQTGTWQAVGCGEWAEVYDNTVIQDMATITSQVQNVYNNGWISVPITEAASISLTGNGYFSGGAGSITNVFMDMRLYETIAGASNGVWAAHISGDFSGGGALWSVVVENLLTNPASSITLTGTQWDGNTWQANVSGTVVDADLVSRNITGVASGVINTIDNVTPSGTFEGSAIGTWSRE